MDLQEILTNIAVPRPDHREALEKTAEYIKGLLTSWDIPFVVQEFALRPYMQFLIGLTLLVLAIILFILIWRKKPIFALIVSILIFPLLFLEFEMFIPIVSGLITKAGENIIVSFKAPDAVRELIFMAHYDSKTDFWDHIQRAKIYKWIPHVFAVGVLLTIWLFFVKKFDALKNKLVTSINLTIAGLIVVYWGLVFLGFGGFIFLPEEKDSFGAVDNGTAVVTLLAMAKDIKDGKVDIGNSNITIIFTSGEETTLQGANFYVNDRWGKTPKLEIPTSLVNLELVAQNGNMVHWEKVGVFLTFNEADPELIDRLNIAHKDVSGKTIEPADKGYITDDSHCFATIGIPFVTVGHSGLPGLGMGGFHSNADNLERVNYKNLEIMIKTLEKYIEGYNTK
jgi:acetylornithine deacetylase/succinyl-diaminopimelate desuccinylase-like protein